MYEPLYVVYYDGQFTHVEQAIENDEGVPFKEAQAACLKYLRSVRDDYALGVKRQKRATLDRPEGFLKEDEG